MTDLLKSQYAKLFLAFTAFVFVLVTLLFFLSSASEEDQNSFSEFRTFSNCVDMARYINKNRRQSYYPMPFFRSGIAEDAVVTSEQKNAGAAQAADYSATNIQVEGVDEADIVKTNGKYIYVIAQNSLYIFENTDGKLEKKSETTIGENLTEMFINGDKVVIFGSNPGSYYGASGLDKSSVTVYELDVNDVEKPKIEKEIGLQGYYTTSRMIGDYVYLIGSASFDDYSMEVTPKEIDKYIPMYRYSLNDSGFTESKTSDCNQISSFGENVNTFSTILGFKIGNSDITTKTILGDSVNVYMSTNNIYFASIVNIYEESEDFGRNNGNIFNKPWRYTIGTNTDVFKLSVDGLNINYASKGQVPGTILNQFSMDEYYDTFRIATSRNSWDGWGDSSDNNLYVLDESMNISGRLEGLGKTERIYSVRFMGDKAYMVTFRETDPFYVIGLKEPQNPELLGELKIPGFSSYLHPISEDLILGVGKDADESSGITEGLKIAVFDVSDVSNPIEKGKLLLGERWSESAVLYDHKAFTYNPKTGLVVIPVELANVDETDYWNGYSFRGFVGIEVAKDGNLKELGRVDHLSKEVRASSFYDDGKPRSLYIDNSLFTYLNGVMKANSLDDYSEIGITRLFE
jgi:uncharacterized secreted protein with C-terminal beta-propeller domain